MASNNTRYCGHLEKEAGRVKKAQVAKKILDRSEALRTDLRKGRALWAEWTTESRRKARKAAGLSFPWRLLGVPGEAKAHLQVSAQVLAPLLPADTGPSPRPGRPGRPGLGLPHSSTHRSRQAERRRRRGAARALPGKGGSVPKRAALPLGLDRGTRALARTAHSAGRPSPSTGECPEQARGTVGPRGAAGRARSRVRGPPSGLAGPVSGPQSALRPVLGTPADPPPPSLLPLYLLPRSPGARKQNEKGPPRQLSPSCLKQAGAGSPP